MLTLSFGFKKPQTGDRGSLWFPALEDDIQQLNDHTHDGITSSKLASTSITPTTQTLSSASWVLVAGGNYRQLVTVPAGIDYDDYGIAVRITNGASAGLEINPVLEKVSDTTYYMYVNDNTIDLKVIYLV